ncbi:hypothetical protein vseg_003718 [Gypsophila vaccaria]
MVDDTKTPSPHTPNHLYAIALNDSPGTKITHVVLKGSNYEEWVKGFRVLLGAKRKLGFINGNLPQPDSEDLDDWLTADYMIIAWVLTLLIQAYGRLYHIATLLANYWKIFDNVFLWKRCQNISIEI